MPVFGGEKAWLTRRTGDIGTAYHWVNGEPAMCLFPANRPASSAGVYVIPLEAAYNYVGSDGHPDAGYMIGAARTAAAVMGFSQQDRFIQRKIVDVIADGIGDLIAMPPEPPDQVEQAVQQEMAGELTIKVDGEVVAEREVPALSEAELDGLH